MDLKLLSIRLLRIAGIGCVAFSVFAGSDSAVSNIFSLGSVIGIKKNQQAQKESVFTVIPRNGGVVFTVFPAICCTLDPVVFSLTGAKIRSLKSGERGSWFWNGLDYKGYRCEDGMYVLYLPGQRNTLSRAFLYLNRSRP
jgi:hypothetical protein